MSADRSRDHALDPGCPDIESSFVYRGSMERAMQPIRSPLSIVQLTLLLALLNKPSWVQAYTAAESFGDAAIAVTGLECPPRSSVSQVWTRSAILKIAPDEVPHKPSRDFPWWGR